MKKSKQMLIGTIFFIVAVVFALLFFVVNPIIKDVYTTRDQFEEDKIEFKAIKKDADQSHVFVDLVENLGKDQELVENALIKKESVVLFIQDIEKISRELGNEVQIAQLPAQKAQKAPSQETPEQKKARLALIEVEKKKVRLSLKVEGNYKNFLRFLYKLENMTYVFKVDSINIGNASDRFGDTLKSTEENPIDFTVGKIAVSFTPKTNIKNEK